MSSIALVLPLVPHGRRTSLRDLSAVLLAPFFQAFVYPVDKYVSGLGTFLRGNTSLFHLYRLGHVFGYRCGILALVAPPLVYTATEPPCSGSPPQRPSGGRRSRPRLRPGPELYIETISFLTSEEWGYLTPPPETCRSF